MIRIEIKKFTTITTTKKEAFVTHEEPTPIMIPGGTGSYDRGEKPAMKKDYVVHDVEERRTQETQLLTQEVADADFDFKAVVTAVNQLNVVTVTDSQWAEVPNAQSPLPINKTNMMNLRERVGALHDLLRDPEPGLTTWRMSYDSAVRNLLSFWDITSVRK